MQEEISKIKQQLDEKNKSYEKETSERKSIEKENLELAKKKTNLEQEVHELKSKWVPFGVIKCFVWIGKTPDSCNKLQQKAVIWPGRSSVFICQYQFSLSSI